MRVDSESKMDLGRSFPVVPGLSAVGQRSCLDNGCLRLTLLIRLSGLTPVGVVDLESDLGSMLCG